MRDLVYIVFHTYEAVTLGSVAVFLNKSDAEDWAQQEFSNATDVNSNYEILPVAREDLHEYF